MGLLWTKNPCRSLGVAKDPHPAQNKPWVCSGPTPRGKEVLGWRRHYTPCRSLGLAEGPHPGQKPRFGERPTSQAEALFYCRAHTQSRRSHIFEQVPHPCHTFCVGAEPTPRTEALVWRRAHTSDRRSLALALDSYPIRRKPWVGAGPTPRTEEAMGWRRAYTPGKSLGLAQAYTPGRRGLGLAQGQHAGQKKPWFGTEPTTQTEEDLCWRSAHTPWRRSLRVAQVLQPGQKPWVEQGSHREQKSWECVGPRFVLAQNEPWFIAVPTPRAKILVWRRAHTSGRSLGLAQGPHCWQKSWLGFLVWLL